MGSPEAKRQIVQAVRCNIFDDAVIDLLPKVWETLIAYVPLPPNAPPASVLVSCDVMVVLAATPAPVRISPVPATPGEMTCRGYAAPVKAVTVKVVRLVLAVNVAPIALVPLPL